MGLLFIYTIAINISAFVFKDCLWVQLPEPFVKSHWLAAISNELGNLPHLLNNLI